MNDEKILGVISPVKGIHNPLPQIRAESYWALFFTNSRIIVAKTVGFGTALGKEVALGGLGGMAGSEVGGAVGGKLGGKLGGIIGAISGGLAAEDQNLKESNANTEAMKNLPPAAIMQKDKSNYSLAYSEIRQVEMQKLLNMPISFIKIQMNDGKKIEFGTVPGNLKGIIKSQIPAFNQYVEIVKKVLGNKVKVKQ